MQHSIAHLELLVLIAICKQTFNLLCFQLFECQFIVLLDTLLGHFTFQIYFSHFQTDYLFNFSVTFQICPPFLLLDINNKKVLIKKIHYKLFYIFEILCEYFPSYNQYIDKWLLLLIAICHNFMKLSLIILLNNKTAIFSTTSF